MTSDKIKRVRCCESNNWEGDYVLVPDRLFDGNVSLEGIAVYARIESISTDRKFPTKQELFDLHKDKISEKRFEEILKNLEEQEFIYFT